MIPVGMVVEIALERLVQIFRNFCQDANTCVHENLYFWVVNDSNNDLDGGDRRCAAG